jgi:hypothetical protein
MSACELFDEAVQAYATSVTMQHQHECKMGCPVYMSKELMMFLNLPYDEKVTSLQVQRYIDAYVTDKKLRQKRLLVVDAALSELLDLPEGARISMLTVHMMLHKHMVCYASQGFIEALEDDVAAKVRRAIHAARPDSVSRCGAAASAPVEQSECSPV